VTGTFRDLSLKFTFDIKRCSIVNNLVVTAQETMDSFDIHTTPHIAAPHLKLPDNTYFLFLFFAFLTAYLYLTKVLPTVNGATDNCLLYLNFPPEKHFA